MQKVERAIDTIAGKLDVVADRSANWAPADLHAMAMAARELAVACRELKAARALLAEVKQPASDPY